jgi:hypothetical protein
METKLNTVCWRRTWLFLCVCVHNVLTKDMILPVCLLSCVATRSYNINKHFRRRVPACPTCSVALKCADLNVNKHKTDAVDLRFGTLSLCITTPANKYKEYFAWYEKARESPVILASSPLSLRTGVVFHLVPWNFLVSYTHSLKINLSSA